MSNDRPVSRQWNVLCYMLILSIPTEMYMYLLHYKPIIP